jgi:MFS family permease
MRARGYVPALIAIGLVVSVISSLGAPLIPTIAGDLHASLSATQWSLTATLLVGAVASPVLGRLGDGPHRRRVLVSALMVVTAGGALAALAGSLSVLVAGRAMQGLGLALMPLTMASARDHLPLPKATTTIAILSVVGAAGVGLGYPITGFIAQYFDASAAFWFGTLASASALVLAVLFVPAPTSRASHGSLDGIGALLIGAGVLALLLALEKAPDWGWLGRNTVGLFLLAVVLLAAWVRNELRVEQPLVELRLLRQRGVLTANVTGFVLGVAMYLGISLITQVVQLPAGINQTVFVAGLTLLPLSAISTLASRFVPAARRRFGVRGVIPAGCASFAAGMLLFALVSSLWAAFVVMALVGLGMGLTFAAMPGLILSSVPQSETSSAMSFYQVTRYVGFSIGSGLAVTLLRAFDGGASVPTESAYSKTFAVGAALCLVAAVIAYVVPGRQLDAPNETAEEREFEIEEGELAAAGLQRD